MNGPIGLLIVHGIGHQAAASVAAPVVTALADTAVISEISVAPGVWSIEGWDRRVIATEANWSDLSSPDNPPRVRVGWKVAYESIATIAATPNAINPTMWVRYVDLVAGSSRLAVAAAVVARGAYELVPESSRASADILVPRWAPDLWAALFVIAFWLGGLVSGLDSTARSHLSTSPLPARVARTTALVLWGMLASVFTMAWQAALAAYVVIVVTAAAILQIAVSLLRLILGLLPAELALWGARLAWSVLILPVQVLLQFLWAWSNLTSIVLVERRVGIALTAAGYPIALLLGFVVVVLLWEVLILLPVLPGVLLSHFLYEVIAEYGLIWEVSFALLALAGLTLLLLRFSRRFFVRVSLPIADLALDITSYLLASRSERHAYQERIEAGIERLRAEGCGEVHVLAHSLGSALVYDWIEGSPTAAACVTMLHTIGSPLNKFWYIDHPQTTRARDERHEGLGGSPRWINYWSRTDPVSGPLRRYGDRVVNRRLRDLGRFGVSHVAYWRDDRVLDAVRAGLRGDPDPHRDTSSTSEGRKAGDVGESAGRLT